MGSNLILWVGVGLILVLCGILLMIGSVWFGGIFCIAYGIFLLIWRAFLRNFRFRREFRRSKMLQGEMTMDITQEGFSTSWGYGEGKLQWGAFSRCLETPHLVLLAIPPRLFYMIPKRAFALPDLDAVWQLLVKKIPQANLPKRDKSAPWREGRKDDDTGAVSV